MKEKKKKDMMMKKNLFFTLLLAVVALSTGIDQGVFAQTGNSDGSALQTQGEIKSGTAPQKKSKLSKRNLMMIEQAESARMRTEKILVAPKDNAEMPMK
jgi:hypothetical protein